MIYLAKVLQAGEQVEEGAKKATNDLIKDLAGFFEFFEVKCLS